jgi:hypothetical protein
MEDRVLQRLHSQTIQRRSPWWTWGAVATCAAVVLIGVWIGVKNPTSPHLPTAGKYGPPTTTPHLPTDGKYGPQGGVGHPAGKYGTLATTPHLPTDGKYGPPVGAKTGIATLPVFPMPTPLTAQERAFMASLQGNSTVAASGADPDSLIAIAEIQIKPLTASGQSSGGDQ